MNTKEALKFATKFESASNQVLKVRRSIIADTILNTMSFAPIYAMKASIIMNSLNLPMWWFIAISAVPALFSADLIVRQMVSCQLSGDQFWGTITDMVSIGLSWAGLSDGMFADVNSFADAFTVQTSMRFLIITLLSIAPVLIIRLSIKEWKKKMDNITVEVDGKQIKVYAPEYINSLEVSEATQYHIEESLKLMDYNNLTIMGRINKRINRKKGKSVTLSPIKKAS